MNDRTKYRKKRIQEVNLGQRVPGTDILAQKYWEFVGSAAEDGEAGPEDPLANPDVLPSDDNVFERPLTERGELQFEAILQAFRTLTKRQQLVLQLMFDGIWDEERGERDYSQEAIAEELGITHQAVTSNLNFIRIKVQRSYEKLMTEKES